MLDEFQSGRANGLNDMGHVAGEYATWSGDQHAWMDANGSVRTLDILRGWETWSVATAYDINDARQILGKACRMDECLSVQLDLVSAVPEPGSYAMLAAGLALLAGRRKWDQRESRRFS